MHLLGIGPQLQPYWTDVFNSKCNAELPIISLLCRLNILHEHSKTHVYSLNFLCLLFSSTKSMSTDGKLKSLMTGGKELLKKVQLHTDILHIMLGRATLHNYQNMYRSNPHLEYVFQEFQMIILSSWAYLQDLVNGKHCRFSPTYGFPPSLLPYLQKQSSRLFYCYCSLFSTDGNESWQSN